MLLEGLIVDFYVIIYYQNQFFFAWLHADHRCFNQYSHQKHFNSCRIYSSSSISSIFASDSCVLTCHKFIPLTTLFALLTSGDKVSLTLFYLIIIIIIIIIIQEPIAPAHNETVPISSYIYQDKVNFFPPQIQQKEWPSPSPTFQP